MKDGPFHLAAATLRPPRGSSAPQAAQMRAWQQAGVKQQILEDVYHAETMQQQQAIAAPQLAVAAKTQGRSKKGLLSIF